MIKAAVPVLFALILTACCQKPLTVMSNCDYPDTAALFGREYVFVDPTFQQYHEGSGATLFYLDPSRENPLRHTSWRYRREFIDVKHKPVATVDGTKEQWIQWLLEDCRVIYTPEDEFATLRNQSPSSTQTSVRDDSPPD